MKSLLTGIDSCSHTSVSSAKVLNLFIYFYCQCLYFFQSIAWKFLFVHVSVSVSVIPFPDSGFPILSFTPGWVGTLWVRVNLPSRIRIETSKLPGGMVTPLIHLRNNGCLL